MDRHVYSTCFATVPTLDDTLKRQMAGLYLASYSASSEDLFLHDLHDKHEVLLLRAGVELVGFTMVRTFEREWQGRRIGVIYSGDTVVDRAHWGQQALAFAWIARMGALKRQCPHLPLYWLLLSKGHRTFRYLPVFARSFHPHWERDRTGRELIPILKAEMIRAKGIARPGRLDLALIFDSRIHGER